MTSTSKPHVIASKANATYKTLRSLTTSQGLKETGQALVSGAKIIAELLAHDAGRAVSWVVRGDRRDEMLAPFATAVGAARLPVVELAGELFRELDVVGTDGALLLVHAPELPRWDPAAPWPRGCTLFVGFQNPENLGAVLRSAAAFGVARIVLLKGSAHPFLPKSLRAASAAAFTVPLTLGPAIADLIPSLPAGMPLVTLDARGRDLDAAAFPDTFGLLPGVEGPGLPAELPPEWRRRIPMAPGVESLNATVATAIALYAWSVSRRQSGP